MTVSDKYKSNIKSVKVKSYPKTNVVNKSISKSKIQLLVTYSNGKKVTIKNGFKLGSYKKTIGKRSIGLDYIGNKLSFTCSFVPAKVSKVKLTPKSKQVVIKITKAAGAKKYEIYRSLKKSSGFKKIATTSKLSYTDKKGLKSKKIYYYKVRAINGSYAGAFSGVYKVKVK